MTGQRGTTLLGTLAVGFLVVIMVGQSLVTGGGEDSPPVRVIAVVGDVGQGDESSLGLRNDFLAYDDDVADQGDVVFVSQIESHNPIRAFFRPGTRQRCSTIRPGRPPISPAPMAPSNASVSACSPTSASEWPIRPRSCSTRMPHSQM